MLGGSDSKTQDGPAYHTQSGSGVDVAVTESGSRGEEMDWRDSQKCPHKDFVSNEQVEVLEGTMIEPREPLGD